MNWKNAFFAAMAAFVVTLAWALKLSSVKTAQGGVQPEKGKLTDDQRLSNVPCAGSYPTLIASDASCRLTNYETYLSSSSTIYADYSVAPPEIDNCDNSQTLKLPAANQRLSYFRITHPCELAGMLSNASASDTLNMYIVMGIEPDPKNPGKAYIDALFQAPRPGSGGSQVVYYDFTTPCPPMCGNQ